MSFLATSPYGRQMTASWICTQCPAQAALIRTDGESLRAEAVRHLEFFGHHVSVTRGTTEEIYPMATTATEVSP